jgi:hypothetical protein
MCVILQAWCQFQCTSSSLRYVNCGPGHIQCTYSSAYLSFNIELKVAPLLLEVSRQFNARYTANLVSNAAHVLRYTLCELWFQTYTMHLQLRIFRLQYSTVGICAATVDITSIQCALYCKLGAKYSAHHPVYAVWNVVPDIYKVFTAPHIYASVYSCRHLRCYCRYHINSMRVILQIWCKIQCTSSRLLCVNCGPGRIQSIYSSAYLCFNIQLQVSAAAIVDIMTLQCALYCKLSDKYSAHPPVYVTWTVVPAISNVLIAPHIQTSLFISR